MLCRLAILPVSDRPRVGLTGPELIGGGAMLTTVFVTQTGTRYHARVDLPCMEKARGYTEIAIDAAADGGLVPCSTCGAPPLPGTSELDRQWLSAISDWAREGVFESFWEQAFARRVLAQTAGISVDDVEPQALITAAGEAYKVDFSIPKAKLVLEVDGYHKDGSPPSQSDLDRRNRRDAALQARGLTVLHFSNAQVQQQPGICRDLVAQAVVNQSIALTPSTPPDVKPVVTAPAQSTSAVPIATSQLEPKSNRGTLVGVVVGAALALGVAVVLVLALGGTGDSAPPTVASGAEDVTANAGATDPVNEQCPSGFPIKGNESTMIAHSPRDRFYDKTIPERCFVDLAAAAVEGYRPAEQ